MANLRRITALTLLLSISTAMPALGQRNETIELKTSARGVAIDGMVKDREGRALSSAEIIVDEQHDATTDAKGAFRIGGLAAGIVEFTARRVGYSPVSSAIQIDSGVSAVHVAITLTPVAVKLGTIVIDGKRYSKALWQTGFYQRQQLGSGHYFDSDVLSRFQTTLGSLLSGVPSVHVDYGTSGIAVALGRKPDGGTCPLALFVDGHPIPWAAQVGFDNVINREDVLAMEVYARESEVPVLIAGKGGAFLGGALGTIDIRDEARGMGQSYADCGAILLWTKPLGRKGE